MKKILKLSSLLAFGTAQFVEASDLIAYWSFYTLTKGKFYVDGELCSTSITQV
jgi:hypothetical protein